MPITVVCSITQNEVVFTRHGRPVAQLTGLQAQRGSDAWG